MTLQTAGALQSYAVCYVLVKCSLILLNTPRYRGRKCYTDIYEKDEVVKEEGKYFS